MNAALPPDIPHLAVEKFRAPVELSMAARADLTWWSEQASQMNGAADSTSSSDRINQCNSSDIPQSEG